MAGLFLDRVSNLALGELLVEKGALSEAQVVEALELSRGRGVRLGEALVSLGYISTDALGYAIGEQYGLKPMDLQPSMVDVDLLARFDIEQLKMHTMLPLIELGNELVVVVSDPNNQDGLSELSAQLPGLSLIPQLGAAEQIRRCLDAVRKPGENAFSSSDPVVRRRDNISGSDRSLPFFRTIPEAESPEFIDWLVGLAANHAGRDVLIRDLNGEVQVCLSPLAVQGGGSDQAEPAEHGLTEMGRWKNVSCLKVRDGLLSRSVPLEYTRGQAARWEYTIKHGEKRFDFLILAPAVQGAAMVMIRALTHLPRWGHNDAVGEEFSPVPLSLDLEAGSYTVLLYDGEVSLERALADFMEEHCREHSFVVSQGVTRCVFRNGLAYPVPYTNMVAAAQGAAATCVVFDHPVEYREAVRLLTSTYPPPSVVVCAPMPRGGSEAGELSPDVEELISRQGATSVRVGSNGGRVSGMDKTLNANGGDN